MLKQNASLEFLQLPTAKKAPFGLGVIDGLSNNTQIFADPTVAVTVLTKLNSNLAIALGNAASGSKVSKAALEKAELAWNNAFKSDALYVSSIANGDAENIALAGFNATKSDRRSATEPESCKNFEAVAPKAPGVINVSVQSQKCPGYLSVAAADGVTVEQHGNQIAISFGGKTTYVAVNTRSRLQFENLPTGTQMHVSVVAFNSAGAGPLTNGQTAVPQ